MAEFTLKPKELKTLRINIGEDSFEIPLRGSLSIKEGVALSSEEGTYSFFKRYIPKDVFERITVDELNQIIEVYKEESDKHSKLSMGELRASLKR
jgi:hypothetical protein